MTVKQSVKYKVPHKYLIKACSNSHKDNWVRNYPNSVAERFLERVKIVFPPLVARPLCIPPLLPALQALAPL